MEKNNKRLILFDIDGTLISSGGAGVRALNRAFFELYGVEEAFGNIHMAGKTDTQIMREGLRLHNYPFIDGHVSNMVKMYLRFLKEEMENPLREMKPGILESLDLLNGMGVPLGLLTGNLEEGAAIKLGPFGLNRYFVDGAFGSDHEDRDMLLPIAIKKFTGRGISFEPKDCIVIGDTPRDVQCAKVHGAFCIAVATGPYSKKDLQSTDADFVLDSLSDMSPLLNLLRTG